MSHSNHGHGPNIGKEAILDAHANHNSGELSDVTNVGAHMKMYFNTDLPFTLLFQPWVIDTTAKLVGAFIGSFILSILYEALGAFRERLLLMAACRGCCPPPGNPGVLGRPAGSSCPGCSRSGGQEADKALVGGDDNGDTPQFRIPSSPLKECIGSYFDKYHLAQTGLHLIQMFVSYMLMLIVMAYNVQLLMAVVLGLAFGYFFCSHRRPMLLRSRTCCH